MGIGKHLILTPFVDHLSPVNPAVMYEVTAAKYVMLGIREFRRLVDEGAIIYRNHPGRKRRIYLKADLDDYLKRLPQGKIGGGRVHPGFDDRGDQGDRS